jgi:hypothetical protein
VARDVVEIVRSVLLGHQIVLPAPVPALVRKR